VQNEERQTIIRIGEYNLALDELLKRNKSESWAFITAYNPYSNALPEEENELRQENLLSRLKEKNFQFLNGYGESTNKDWQPEKSVLIFNIDRETARSLGREFEQNAIVIGQIGSKPELVWCFNIEHTNRIKINKSNRKSNKDKK
jgi:hypothetical protein